MNCSGKKWRTEVRRYVGYVKVQIRVKTNGNGCPVPKTGTGRYKFKGKRAGGTPAYRQAGQPYRVNCSLVIVASHGGAAFADQEVQVGA